MNDKEFVELVNQHRTMKEAAHALGMAFSTFKRKAVKLSVYTPNQGFKPEYFGGGARGADLDEILVDNSEYKGGTYKLKAKLLEAGLIKEECSICPVKNIWNGKPISLHLDHINGKNNDNRLENLRMLCPNCHSQTDTYCGKNKGVSKRA